MFISCYVKHLETISIKYMLRAIHIEMLTTISIIKIE